MFQPKTFQMKAGNPILMIDLSSFEEFQGEKPSLLLDRHPDGKHLILQVETADVFLAAVWNNETKQLVWSPEEDAYGLAWFQQGRQIAALQNSRLSPEDFTFALYSWPQGFLIQQCSLRFPMGYLFDLIISPNSDLAICQWTDQCEFGFEFVGIQEHSVAQIAQNGYLNPTTNVSTRPAFSPDGRIWVCCSQDNTSWWADDNTLGNFDRRPAKGGKREIGTVMVFHQTQKRGEFPLILTVPAGYLPQDLKTPDSFTQETLYLSNPTFVDMRHIKIVLPTGEAQIYDLSSLSVNPPAEYG